MSELQNLHPDPVSPFRNLPKSSTRGWAAILEEAERTNMWIYHPQSENWYSPAEFEAKYGSTIREDTDFCSELRLCHPEEGLNVMTKMLKEMTDELDRLAVKVVRYYRNGGTSPVQS